MDEGFAYDVFFYVQLDLWKLEVQIIRILLHRLGLNALCYILLGEPPELNHVACLYAKCRYPSPSRGLPKGGYQNVLRMLLDRCSTHERSDYVAYVHAQCPRHPPSHPIMSILPPLAHYVYTPNLSLPFRES
jgi:hypothetical protein